MEDYRRSERPGSYKTWSEHLEARLALLAELYEALVDEGPESEEQEFIHENILDMLNWRDDNPFILAA